MNELTIVSLAQTCIWGGGGGNQVFLVVQVPLLVLMVAGSNLGICSTLRVLDAVIYGCSLVTLPSLPHELATTLAHIAAHLDVEIIVGVEVLVPHSLFPASILISGHCYFLPVVQH